MQDRNNTKQLEPSAQPKDRTISDLVVRNVVVGVGAASVLYPFDLLMHKLHNKNTSKATPKVVTARPCRVGLAAAAWTSYKYAITGATMKITTKQQSQGAKAFMMDEKPTMNESIDAMEGAAEASEATLSKSKDIKNIATDVGASLLFGGMEAFITQSNANKSVLSKYALEAKKEGRSFTFPELKAPMDKWRFHIAGFPIRASKSTLQLGAFMATATMEQYLLESGKDKITAKIGSVAAVATTFGTVGNAVELCYTRQIKTMDKTTLSVSNMRNVTSAILKEGGLRGFSAGALFSMSYLAVVQAIVPPIEAYADDDVLPAKREIESKAAEKIKNRPGFFFSERPYFKALDQVAEAIDEQSQKNPFSRPGID